MSRRRPGRTRSPHSPGAPRPRAKPAKDTRAPAAPPARDWSTSASTTITAILRTAWRRLSRGTRVLVALLATTAIAAAVPGAIPYVADRALDIFNNPALRVDVKTYGPTAGLYVASEKVHTEPELVVTGLVEPEWVSVGDSQQILTLEGRRAGSVAITGLVAEVIERRAPLVGTFVGGGAEGQVDNTLLELRLDDPQGVPLGTDGAPYFAAHHLVLARGELHVIRVTSWTDKCYCTWRLRMTYHYRGADHTLLVPAPDRPPFQLTAAAPPTDYQVQYVLQGSSWTRTDCRTDRARCAKAHLPSNKPAW